MPVQVKDPSDIQSAYDEFADPTLQNAEARGSDAAYVDSGLDQLEAYANDPANKVKEAEDGAANTGNWSVNRSENKRPHQPLSSGQRAMRLLKKGGPTGGIIGGVIAAAMGLGSIIGGPAMLLNHITAGFLDKWDTRSTTATIRTNKLLVKKLVGDSTSGSCNYVKIMCRYKKPSSKLLRNLEKQGVRAIDEAGDVIKPNKVFPNTRPKEFEFTRSNGVKTKISAAEFSRALQNDVEFRKAFHTAYNPRFHNFADSVFDKVLRVFGGSKTSKIAGAADEAAAKKKINADVAGEDVGAKAAIREGTDEAAEGVIKKIFGKEIDAILTKLGKSGKGSGISLAAGAACIVADAPGVTAKIVRSYQMAQLIKFALIFLTVADKIKAGDATSSEVSVLGNMLTKVTKDSSGNITNRAATDSFGVKYGLFGDTDTNLQTTGHDYNKFSPGGNIVASLAGITQYTDSKLKKDSCAVATNPLTGVAINAALLLNSGETLGITALLAGLNWAIGEAVGAALQQAAGPISDFFVTHFGDLFKDMLSSFLGDITQNLVGEDVGNALASGAAHLLSQSANAGGNVPLSITGALAFEQVTKQVNLAYAEEDRLDKSPFDVSSPNTFLGSIATQLIPYMSSMSSVSGFFSAVSSISLGSLGSLLGSPVKAADTKQYTMCSDTSLNNGETAVGPFCNVVYGIPTEYINIDPEDVLQYLIDNNQVDPETGEPTPDKDLELWMSTCLDGKTDQVANCQIDGNNPTISDADRKRFAYYALYTVDHQIQKNMDGEDETETDTPVTTDPGESGDTPVPAIEGLPQQGVKDTAEGRQQAWAIAQQFIDDLNKIRKGKKGYPFKDIPSSSIGYNRSAGTPGKSASGGPCFAGASNCDQCYALSAWFLDKYTTQKIGTTTGAGDGVVAYLKKQGVPTGNEAKVYSVFSYGRAVSGTGAHTGIVVGIDGDYAITVENNYNLGGTLYINKRPKSGAEFRQTGNKTVFAYINGIMRSTPKKY